MSKLCNGYSKTIDTSGSVTILIRYDLKVILERQRKDALKKHYDIIRIFEKINSHEGFRNVYCDIICKLEMLVEEHIEEICYNSKTLTVNIFKDQISLCDLSEVNALSLVKWYEKYLYHIDYNTNKDIIYNLLYTAEHSILNCGQISEMILKNKHLKIIIVSPRNYFWNWPIESHYEFLEKIKNRGYSLGVDPDIDDVLYETNRIHLKLVIMEAENIILILRKMPDDTPIGNLLSTSVVEQMSRGQCKDLVNVYTGLFKVNTCNKIEPIYINKLLKFVENLDDIVSMSSKVKIIIDLLKFMDSLKADFVNEDYLGL